MRTANDEFSGHCLALTLLGSFLTDAYDGDIRRREEVSRRLAHDVRQGVHARKVMESYQTWFGEGPELSVLRMLGLFDRPVDEEALGALLKPPSIRGLTESLTDLSSAEWRTILARLRRANPISGEDRHNPGHLDTHPWGSPVEMGIEGQSLTAEDRLFILMQAREYLTDIRGMGAPEARICSESAASLCHSLDNPRLLCLALKGQRLYKLMTDKASAALQIAERVHSLAQEQDEPTLMIEAYDALACTLYWLGDFEQAREYAMRGVQIWRSGNVQSRAEGFGGAVANCLCYQAVSEWHLGEIATCQTTIAEAVALATELHATGSLALALQFAAILAYFERNPVEADRLASDLIELATRHNFAYWLTMGGVLRGWARSASGDRAEGISLIEDGIREYRASGSIIGLPFFLTRKAEALHMADRTSEALEAINEAEALVERTGARWWCAELHRLRGVFLTAIGAEESQIEASFCAAIRTAKEQKSISIAKRAEGTYAEYRRQKASALGGRGFRLPLC